MQTTLTRARIERMEPETDDAVSLYLLPEEIKTFRPGQFITLRINIDGQMHQRSYSLSSDPIDDLWRITVKRVKKGVVSSYLTQQASLGEWVECTEPEGHFCLLESTEEFPRVFVGAGSGITPLYSMLRESLKNSSAPHLLFYGNRKKENVIFKQGLEALRSEYPQLKIFYYYSKESMLTSLFKRNLDYKRGRIAPEDVWYEVLELGDQAFDAEYYLCGPSQMNVSVKQELLSRSVSEEKIRMEYYTAAESSASDEACDSSVRVHLLGEEINIEVKAGDNILGSLIDQGYDPPHSCTSGACCTCMAVLKKGRVSMDRTDALSKSEIKNGFILTCQAVPETEEVEVDFNIYD